MMMKTLTEKYVYLAFLLELQALLLNGLGGKQLGSGQSEKLITVSRF
jgi:hypothetical protein